MTNRIPAILTYGLIAMMLIGCGSATAAANEQSASAGTQTGSLGEAQDASDDGEVTRPDGWSEETHGSSADPNYEVVFPQDEVNRIDITITSDNWQAMLDDMTALYGEQGTGGGMGGFGDGGQPPDGMAPPDGAERPEGMEPPEGMELPEGAAPQGGGPGFGGGMMGGMGTDENPVWVPATIEFEGDTWANVGIRFKGNSSLMSTWRSGSLKIPFKLDFDEFEDQYPEIEDQRFYGFRQLTFSSNYSDNSMLREKVTADVFREAGIAAPNTAFYAVYVDYGEGPIYFGLYTMVEVVEDTVIETQFEDDSGNVYKPEGQGATFAEEAFSEASFDKETNQDEDDYSDILALYDALHSELRTTDPAAWRSDLEAVFDVDTFLHWLAVNATLQNWDTYGTMSHNYYLYDDPTSGQLTWIPWDNNMALSGGGMGRVLSLDMETVGEQWPLISYLMADEVYHAVYVNYVEDTVNGAFEPAKMAATYQELHDLVQPYVTGDNGEIEGYTSLSSPDAFDQALDDLIDHAQSRYDAAEAYLASQS